ncbi:MAG TPA: HIT family protein [Acidobacteriota bacterium]|jgi:histidine triad (HIT) family protein
MSTNSEKSCGFCEILDGTVPTPYVFQDPVSAAFLDHRPLFPGHCLLVPKSHYTTLTDLPEDLLAPLFSNAKLLARAVEIALKAEGSFVAINNRVSQSVPHFHIHIVPRRRKDGLKGFFWPRHAYPDAEAMHSVLHDLQQTVNKLRNSAGSL